MALVEIAQNNSEIIAPLEIFIRSGELYFGNAPTVISTMLYSYIVITFWHPGAKIGGMCHFVSLNPAEGKHDMHYGDSAITEFARLAKKYHTPVKEYEIRIFARATGLPGNIKEGSGDSEKVRRLLSKHRFNITELGISAEWSRKIKLDLSDGSVEKKVIKRQGVDAGLTATGEQSRNTSIDAIEILLHPGEFYFGKAPCTISTLLGSCVSVTLWHPKRKIGGMCHIILPESPDGKYAIRYGDFAIAEFAKQAVKYGTRTIEYEVHIYGGSDMFPDMRKTSVMKIGDRNINKVKELLKHYNFCIKEIDTGGTDSRKIKLDLSDGSVVIHKISKSAQG